MPVTSISAHNAALLSAIEEQLGLKLEPQTIPLPVLGDRSRREACRKLINERGRAAIVRRSPLSFSGISSLRDLTLLDCLAFRSKLL